MKPLSHPSKLQVSTPSDLEIVMTRDFHAPRQLVWDAMVKPELLRTWLYSPEGWTMTVCEGDIRVGGTYRWAWTDASGELALTIRGEYKEVRAPGRIVHTEEMAMGCGGPIGTLLSTLELTERRPGVTSMWMQLAFASKAERDGALASGMERGMEAGYVTLDGQLAPK